MEGQEKRVMVTGGSGFLGRSVVASLAGNQGPEGLTVSADLALPDPGERIPGVVYEIIDVTDGGAVSDGVAGHGIDTVVHLASIVNPGRDTSEEQEFQVDVEGSRNVFEACVEHGVGRVVVSSSGAAYGYHADNPVPLSETDPLRGNEAFPYSRHKRLVEEMLADYRSTNPELEQVVLRIGTILGETVDNQITALFEKDRVLEVRGSETPFVFIWDEDVAAIITLAAGSGPAGIYNVAGDGTVTVAQIAQALGKSTLTLPAWLIRAALFVGNRLGRTPHGPAQVDFLRYRPVLDNTRLKEVFGYTPSKTTREAFLAWAGHRRISGSGS